MEAKCEACLNVNVVWFTLWTTVCDHDRDAPGVGVLVTAPLQRHQQDSVLCITLDLCMGGLTEGIKRNPTQLACWAWLQVSNLPSAQQS